MKKIMGKHSFLSLLFLILLSAAIALSVTACAKDDGGDPSETEGIKESGMENGKVLGTGQTQITVEVYHADGTVKSFTVKTDKTTVGDALTEVGLISGSNGQYGLEVFTVDGKKHEYSNGGKYWAFYINGEYAMNGVSSTDVVGGSTYAFKVE